MKKVRELKGMIPFRTALYSLLLCFLLAACTKPIDADFSGQEKVGLADDEMVWVLQVHREPTESWLPEADATDSSLVKTFNVPLFEQVLPEIIRDLFNGKLDGYENFEFAEELKPIENLDERLKSLGVSKKDFSPFTHVFEVFSVVRSQRGKYKSDVKYIQLIWHDPKGKQNNRNFATIRLDQIRTNGDYYMQVEDVRVAFLQYIGLQKYQFYPYYVRDNRREHTVESPEEAQYLREMVMSGNWDRVEWVEGKVNISGRKRIKLQPSEIADFSGVYQFPASSKDSTGKPRELYITAERDYLIADWSHRFRVEKVLPFMENAFFSPGGEVYVFDYDEDKFTGQLFFLNRLDTLIGELVVNHR